MYMIHNEKDCLHMNHNNFELNDLKSFVKVIDCGSFTDAAQELNVTRGHISKQIKKLEESLNLRLINRTTRTLSLTEYGDKLYHEAKASFIQIDQAVKATIQNSEEIAGKIRINSVGEIIGEDIIAPLLAQFCLKYPKVQLALDFSSSRSHLIGDQFDLILRMGKLEDSNFMARKLSDINIHVLASPKYIERNERIKVPKDLESHNCITGSIKKWSFIHSKTKKKTEINVTGNLTCPNGRVLLNCAKAHLGIVRIPEFYCKKELKNKTLVPVFKSWGAEKVPLHALYYSNKLQPKRMALLIDFLKEKLPN